MESNVVSKVDPELLKENIRRKIEAISARERAVQQQESYVHLDRVWINFKYLQSADLKQHLVKLMPQLKESCGDCWIRPPSKGARKRGFFLALEARVPELSFFILLSHDAVIANAIYSITGLEIAKDTLCDNEMEAREIFDKRLMPFLMKKASSYCSIIDGEMDDEDKTSKRRKKMKPDATKFVFAKTMYLGKWYYKFVGYPRMSKLINQPCIHAEFKLTGATTIKKKTGIVTFDHMIKFLENEIESWFRKQRNDALYFVEINHDTHGRFIQNMQNRQTSAGYVICEGRKHVCLKIKPDLASRKFCEMHKITTSAQLYYFYKKEKAALKKCKEIEEITDLQKKILKLSDVRLKSFFKHYNSAYLDRYI